jgi:hypothetical protein
VRHVAPSWPFTALTSLRLVRCGVECLERLERLGGLVELKLAEIIRLRVLHVALPRLRSLHVDRCVLLEEMHVAAPGLRELQVTACTLRGLAVAHLTRLERLELMCGAPADLGELAGLAALRRLSVYVADGARGVESLARLTALTDLTVGAFPEKDDATLAAIDALAARAHRMSNVSLTGCAPELVRTLTRENVRLYPRA